MDWNVYKTGGVGGEWEPVTHPLVEFNDKSGEFVSMVLEEWSIDGQTATLKMREDHVWHDGEDVTAEDMVTKMKLDMFVGSPLNDFLAGVSADGDYTVNLDLTEEISEQVLLWTLYNLMLDTPTSVYGKFREMIEEGEKEDKEIQTQLSSEFSLEEPVGFGPTKFASTSASKLTLGKWDDHPFANEFNFSGYEYKYLPSNQKTWAAAKGNEVDGFDHFIPMDVVKGLPDSFVHKLYPAYVGLGIAMNHEHPVFGKKKVRQAMAHAIRRPQVAEIAGGKLKVGAEYITGTAVSNREKYFSDVIDQFNRYDKPEEEGKKLMKDAGYSIENGNWVKDDGSPIEANVHADAAASDWVSGARSVSSQLS
jgi:peptide/nickel transport system substrate-binding protein